MLSPFHHHHPPPASTSAAAAASFRPPPPLHPTISSSPPLVRGKRSNILRASASASASASMTLREVAAELAAEVKARLGAQLLPSAVPEDVLDFRNRAGTAAGSIDIRRGAPGSSVDLILESFLHCEVPNGAIDIASLIAFLNGSTDAPHFIMDLIQGGPTSLVVLLDLLPRTDLALHPDYIDKFYQDTQLDKQQQELEKLPQVQPYRSPSLYIRSALSPTAIAVSIVCGEDGQVTMEEIVRGQLAITAKEVLRIWLHKCAESTAQMQEIDRENMLRRDCIVKSKSVEIDLSANLPRMFDPDVASRVVGEIQKAFGVQDGRQN